MGIILNFYVFHELAHIKLDEDSNMLAEYIGFAKKAYRETNADYTDGGYSVPLEDVACDAYSLDLIFDYIFGQTNNYHYSEVVSAYVSTLANMTVLDYCQNKEKSWKYEYDLCWIRIILALATVSIKKSSQTFDFWFRVQEKVKIAKQEYTSYMVVVENMMSEIDYKYEDVGESCIPFSFEWMREFDNDLRMIQSIK